MKCLFSFGNELKNISGGKRLFQLNIFCPKILGPPLHAYMGQRCILCISLPYMMVDQLGGHVLMTLQKLSFMIHFLSTVINLQNSGTFYFLVGHLWFIVQVVHAIKYSYHFRHWHNTRMGSNPNYKSSLPFEGPHFGMFFGR